MSLTQIQLREERKAELEAHIKAVNAMLPVQRVVTDSEGDKDEEDGNDGWEGIPDPVQNGVDHEEEYMDEDKYTTVTVEEVDVSRDGLKRLQGGEEHEDEEEETTQTVGARMPASKSKRDPSKKVRDKDKRIKKKKKSFRYESPAERKMNRVKERARKSKAAKARRGE